MRNYLFAVTVRLSILGTIVLFYPLNMQAMSGDCASWQEGESWSLEGNANPLCLDKKELMEARKQGLSHALKYPIAITGLLIPEEPIRKMLKPGGINPVKHLIAGIAKMFTGFSSLDNILTEVGLYSFPQEEGSGAYYVPFPNGIRPSHPMGTSYLERHGEMGVTFSCAACHTGQLFGRRVLGLTNRFPKANDFFVTGKQLTSAVSPSLFQLATGANSNQTKIYSETLENLQYVETRPPQILGLDTSLAHVAISLSHRGLNGEGEKNTAFANKPRVEPLRQSPAESKPAVWWNVKYKNRWLLDGSVLSGNPILTNILWNEIGRGTDLEELRHWIDANPQVITELTAAVYQSQPPHITDFIEAQTIDLDAAKRGQTTFTLLCSRCHGEYEKAWDAANADHLSAKEKLKTLKVYYHEETPVYDVGTNARRAEGMASLEQLNDLNFSKAFGIKVAKQNGYIPPPLEGIWARYPYLHNNSVPSLCALLSPGSQRPKAYMAVEAVDIDKDFDLSCNGYPVSALNTKSETYFDGQRPGLSNEGHDEGIFLDDGQPVLSETERDDLIVFLQTL